ncbi:MAG: HlyD family efflux transporter periplasmic adaptor subunit [Desulfovibrio sp.]|nr:HlyD family efflux transporter periplasmic adaptor subunit [Desulfovibrio sp.]
MEEPLYIEMPKARKSRMPLILYGLSVCVLALAAVWTWAALGEKIESVQAVADCDVQAVSADVSARLVSLDVKPGDSVLAGQVVGRMDYSAYAGHLNEARHDVAGLRPPDSAEIAARLKEAAAFEENMVKRLAKARNEEEMRKRAYDESVAAHVKVQLRLRSMPDSEWQSARYRAVKKEEADARGRMESAREEFEQVSRVRAAMGQELERVRSEILEAKTLASQGRYARYAQPGHRPAPVAAAPEMELRAPVSGRVLPESAVPGQIVRQGEPVLLIQPDGAEQKAWITAYFPLEKRDVIQEGAPCEIEMSGDGQRFSGSIEKVLAPGPLPAGKDDEKYLTVRVRLGTDAVGRDAAASLRPGQKAVCRVKTHSLFGLFR